MGNALKIKVMICYKVRCNLYFHSFLLNGNQRWVIFKE